MQIIMLKCKVPTAVGCAACSVTEQVVVGYACSVTEQVVEGYACSVTEQGVVGYACSWESQDEMGRRRGMSHV
eukprot:350015-Chlamydomonas_euryale.AAC.14